MIKEKYPPIWGQLYNGTCIHCNTTHLLKDNNSTESIKNGDRGAEWFTTDETSGKNT